MHCQVPCDFAPTYNAGPVGLPQSYNPALESGGTDGIGANQGEPWGGATLSDSNRATEVNGSVTQRCVSRQGPTLLSHSSSCHTPHTT